METVFLKFSADERDLIRAARHSDEALGQVLGKVKETSAATVEGAARQRQALEALYREYSRVAREARQGSSEQIAANRLAGQAAKRLGLEYQEAGRRVSFFGRDISRAERGALAGSGAFRGLGRSIAFASGTFLGAAGFTALIRNAIEKASNLAEQTTKTERVFGSWGRTILAWSKTTGTSLGLAQTESLETASTFGALLRPMGVVPGKAAAMSRSLVTLAADLASFYNANQTDVLRALQAGLVGQVRPLRQYGISLDQTRIKAEALRLGLLKGSVDAGKVADAQERVAIAQARLNKALHDYGPGTTQVAAATVLLHQAQRALADSMSGVHGQLTAQQKALAAYSLIMKDSAIAHGDFARTSGGLANQLRIMHAQVSDLEAELGQALMPTVLRLVKRFNEWASDSEHQAEIQRDLTTAIHDVGVFLQALSDIGRAFLPVLRAVVDDVGGVRNALLLLLALKVASKLAAWSAAFQALGVAAGSAGAAGEVTSLRASLLKLTLMRAIVVAIGIKLIDDATGHHIRDFNTWFYNNVTRNVVKGVTLGQYDPGPSRDQRSRGGGPRYGPQNAGTYPLSAPGRIIGSPGAGTHSRTERGYIWQDDDAVDIEMEPGAQVVAVENGVLIKARYGGDSGRFSGWGVTLVADSGNQYFYKHIKSLYRHKGRVRAGEIIGVGTTTGHLHFAKKGARTVGQVIGSTTGGPPPGARGPVGTAHRGQSQPGAPPPSDGGRNPTTDLVVAKRRTGRSDPGLAIVPGKLTAEQERVANLIYATAIARGASPEVALAMVAAAYAESKLNPRARGGGLFQINAAGNPKTYARYMALLAKGYDPTTAGVMAMVGEFIGESRKHPSAGPAAIAAYAERPSRQAIQRAGYKSVEAFYQQSLGSIFGYGDSGGYGISDSRKKRRRPDASTLQQEIQIVEYILHHLDRVLPAQRERIAALANELRNDLAQVVTPADLERTKGRFNRLAKLWANAARLKVDKQAAAKDLKDLMKLYGELPDDLRAELEPKMQKLRELLSKATTAKDIERLKKSLTDMRTAIDDAMQKVRDRFDKAWGRFKDRVLELFDKGVTGRIAMGIEFGGEELAKAQAQKAVDRARGQLAEIEKAGLDEQEQAVKQKAEALLVAETAYQDALIQGDRSMISRRAAELAEAQNQFESIQTDGLSEQEQAYMDAWKRLLEGQDQLNQAQVASEQKKWEELTGEQRQGIEDMLDELGAKLAKRKITAAEARKQIAAEFAKYGIDINADLSNVMGSAFQDAFTGAMNALTKALEELIKVLDGTKKKVKETGDEAAAAAPKIDAAARAAHGTGPVVDEGEEPHALGGFIHGRPRLTRYMPHFALGGIVPTAVGYGDRVTASLTPGELVLTRAMEGNLAKQLSATTAAGGVTWTGDVVVHGSVLTDRDLAEVVRNEFKRLGRLTGGDVYGGYVTR